MSYATSPNLGMPSQGQHSGTMTGLVLTTDFQPVSILAVLQAAGIDVSALPKVPAHPVLAAQAHAMATPRPQEAPQPAAAPTEPPWAEPPQEAPQPPQEATEQPEVAHHTFHRDRGGKGRAR